MSDPVFMQLPYTIRAMSLDESRRVWWPKDRVERDLYFAARDGDRSILLFNSKKGARCALYVPTKELRRPGVIKQPKVTVLYDQKRSG